MLKYLFWFIIVPALLPVFLVFWYVYSKDKHEREPLALVLKIFFFGALFSPVCIPIERALDNVIWYWFGYDYTLYELIENVIGVGLVEETVKLTVFMIFIWKNKEFNFRYDGIVYAVAASLGFAALENVMYVISYGTAISIPRAIFSIPGHAAFAIFMGFFLSRAKHWALRGIGFFTILALLFAIAIPTIIHGIYDFLLSDAIQLTPQKYIFFLFVFILDWLSWRILRHEFRTDRPL